MHPEYIKIVQSVRHEHIWVLTTRTGSYQANFQGCHQLAKAPFNLPPLPPLGPCLYCSVQILLDCQYGDLISIESPSPSWPETLSKTERHICKPRASHLEMDDS